MDNYNYPPGADTSDAPWNQSEPDEIGVELTINYTLSKTIDIVTTNYIPGESGVDWDRDVDEEGNVINVASSYSLPPDFSETNFKEEFEREHMSITALLKELQETKEAELLTLQKQLSECSDRTEKFKISSQIRKVTYIIEECNGWELEDVDYEYDC